MSPGRVCVGGLPLSHRTPDERSSRRIVESGNLDAFLTAVAVVRGAPATAAEKARRPAPLPIALVSEDVRRAISADSPVVVLSVDTVLKQLARHPELTVSDYRHIPDLVRHGEATVSVTGDSVVFLRRFEEYWYKAAVKRTPTKLYLTSFHRVRATDLRRAKRRAARGGAPHPAEAGNPT